MPRRLSAGTAAIDWVDVAAVAVAIPQFAEASLPFFALARHGGRQATVAACAYALGVQPQAVTAALVRAELKRLEAAAGGL